MLCCGAAVDDARKVLVDGHFILVLPQELLHGMADVNFTGKDDKPVERTIPVGLTLHVESIPGKEAVAVGQQQTLYRQVTANGYQPVVLTPLGIGKPQLVIQLPNSHVLLGVLALAGVTAHY